MKAILASLLVASALAVPAKRDVISQSGVSFSGNATVNGNYDMQYRASSLTAASVSGVSYVTYYSYEVDASGSPQSGSASASGIVGAAYAFNVLGVLTAPPTFWAMYFDASADYTASGNGYNADVSGSASFVGTVYYKMEEIDTNGDVVNTVMFKDMTFSSSGVQNAGTNDELSYVTLSATDNGLTVELTVITSNVVGTLNVGAVITPTSMESVLEISGYSYADTANFLRLTITSCSASASGSGSYSGTVNYIGSGSSAPYVWLAGEATVDGDTVTVSVSGWTDIDASELGSSILQTQFSGSSSTSSASQVSMVTVDFPANANSISYDPQVGFNYPGAASSLVPSIMVAFAAIVALLNRF